MTALSLPQGGLGLASGSLVGFSLGLVGGGGSILAVPLLVYLVGVDSPHVAIGTSAVAVAANARFGAVFPTSILIIIIVVVGVSRRHTHDGDKAQPIGNFLGLSEAEATGMWLSAGAAVTSDQQKLDAAA
jgi:hypothetical protein